MPYPRNKRGFIDKKRIFYFVVKELGVSALETDDFLDEMEFKKLGWLFEEHNKEEKQRYETLAHTISVGYARTQTKKKVELFKEQKKTGVTKITEEEKQREIDRLKNKFRGVMS